MARPALSVIIPVRSGERAHLSLLEQLDKDPHVLEILILSEGSRAKSLNAGAAQAKGPYLWFLHADSLLEDDSVEALVSALKNEPDALHFFDLNFADDGSTFVRLNQWGGNLRSRLFRLPFGDQGLACTRAVFDRIGPYPEDVPYGEDHLFVWQAHRKKIAVRPIGKPLLTSARTYRDRGWLALTLLYQYRWIAQALPEIWKMLRGRSL